MPATAYTTIINNLSPPFDESLTLFVKGVGSNLIGMMLSKSILLFLILSGGHILFCDAQDDAGSGSGSDDDSEG